MELIKRKNELNKRKLELTEELIKADELIVRVRTKDEKTNRPIFINPEVKDNWKVIKTSTYTKYVKI